MQLKLCCWEKRSQLVFSETKDRPTTKRLPDSRSRSLMAPPSRYEGYGPPHLVPKFGAQTLQTSLQTSLHDHQPGRSICSGIIYVLSSGKSKFWRNPCASQSSS